MNSDLKDLPGDVSHCHAMISELQSQVDTKDAFIKKLQHQIEQLLRYRYGQRADRINPNQLVFEAMKELMEDGGEVKEEAHPPSEAPTRPRREHRGHGRQPLPDHLQRERVVHDVPLEKRICTGCGREKARIGEDVSERLEFRPATLYVIQDVCPRYGCKHCASSVVSGQKPMQPIEKGLAGPGLLAHVITSKYCDHLPLNRLEGMFERQGVSISRKTMCDWMGASAELLNPLYELMKVRVLQSKVIHTDDTPVKVQNLKATKTRLGRLWVYVGDSKNPYVVYDYTPSRSRDGPAGFLSEFRGFLQADAYSGYDRLYASGEVTEVACWAHARRKFVDAQSTDLSRAVIATAWIKMLYRIETEGHDVPPAERRQLRLEKADPILREFASWLQAQEKEVLPKSPIGEAVGYALNNWKALTRYLEDGDLAIDNNQAERALRTIAIGRKNWLFFGNDKGGRTAATLISFVMTCKSHDMDPFAYLRDVIERISAHPAKRLDELLPDRWKIEKELQEEEPGNTVSAAV